MCVWFIQRRKAVTGVFVPSNLKNLLVTGVFGEKVSSYIIYYSITTLTTLTPSQTTHLMSRFPINYIHNTGELEGGPCNQTNTHIALPSYTSIHIYLSLLPFSSFPQRWTASACATWHTRYKSRCSCKSSTPHSSECHTPPIVCQGTRLYTQLRSKPTTGSPWFSSTDNVLLCVCVCVCVSQGGRPLN